MSLSGAAPALGQVDVDLELVLAVDISRSMDYDEQQLQRDGYVEALRHPEVLAAIQSGPVGRIVVTYVEWAGPFHQAMVVPWAGFELATLLNRVGVQPGAKYVAFETLVRPEEMPGQRTAMLDWPYREGLRLDEAMHPLTILATGLYDEPLPRQNGAPIRLVVPWKYGFKSIKSIVKISLVADQPQTTWNMQNPREYGFYSNVNPTVDHPRWSQASERRIGGGFFAPRVDTQMFNGYGDQVAGLYAGMDLAKDY